jgi:tetratricopeptide (TPR) repeat protein
MTNGPGTAGMKVPTVSTQLEAALELRSAGRLAEALDMLVLGDECTPCLYTLRGEIEFALGRFQDAALSYSSVVISEPDHVVAHYNLALCLQRAQRWGVASEAFQRVLRLDAQHPEARLGLGICLLHLNRAEDALDQFTEDCLDGKKDSAAFGMAVALQLLHRFDEASVAYEILLASDPDSEEILSNLIAMSIETHDLRRTQNYSLRLLNVSRQSKLALQGLATVALQNWENDAAASYCGRILELAPDCLEAWHNFRIAIDRSPFNFSQPAIAVLPGRT